MNKDRTLSSVVCDSISVDIVDDDGFPKRKDGYERGIWEEEMMNRYDPKKSEAELTD